MNYRKHYDRLIERARNRVPDGYVERHHVVPRCMGGGDEKANLVALTAEEHYVAHQLLVKMYPSESKLVYSARMMSAGGPQHAGRINNKSYGWIRRRFNAVIGAAISAATLGIPKSAEHCAALSAAHKGKPLSASHRENIGVANRGRKPSDATIAGVIAYWTGRPKSDETRAKIAASLHGRKASAETRAKLSAMRAGKPRPEMRGRKHSPEHRAAISASTRAHFAINPKAPLTLEQRAKISATLTGKPWSEAQYAARQKSKAMSTNG